MSAALFDVIGVNLKTHTARVMETGKTERNADAIISMAVMRRGCDEEIFVAAQVGQYKDGDHYP